MEVQQHFSDCLKGMGKWPQLILLVAVLTLVTNAVDLDLDGEHISAANVEIQSDSSDEASRSRVNDQELNSEAADGQASRTLIRSDKSTSDFGAPTNLPLGGSGAVKPAATATCEIAFDADPTLMATKLGVSRFNCCPTLALTQWLAAGFRS